MSAFARQYEEDASRQQRQLIQRITYHLELVVIEIQFLQLLQLTKHFRVEKRHCILSETQPFHMSRKALQSQRRQRGHARMYELEILHPTRWRSRTSPHTGEDDDKPRTSASSGKSSRGSSSFSSTSSQADVYSDPSSWPSADGSTTRAVGLVRVISSKEVGSVKEVLLTALRRRDPCLLYSSVPQHLIQT